jgi:hypothetical protein
LSRNLDKHPFSQVEPLAYLIAMVKKAVMAIIVITVFLFSLVDGLHVVEVAKANFFPGPALGIESPSPRVVYTNNSIPLRIVAHVANPTPEIISITSSLDENSNLTLTNLNKTLRTPDHIDGSEFYAETVLENLVEGNHTLKAYSKDSSGGEMSASVEFIFDTHFTSPLSVLSPQNITFTTSEVPLVIVCSDEIISADYQLDGIGLGPISTNLTMTDLSLGGHKIIVLVWTVHGVFSETIYFTVSNQTPTPTPTPIPTVPEFTVTLISPPPDSHFVNKTIELSIKNQPSYPNYGFFYNVRMRINDGNWSLLYSIDDVPIQSTGEYTNLSYPSFQPVVEYQYDLGDRIQDLFAGDKVDFQVQAKIGSIHRTFNPNAANQLEMYPYVFTGEVSGWSSIQTIIIPDDNALPSTSSPSSTITPSTSIPEFPLLVILPLLFAVSSFLIFIKKRAKNR